MVFKIQKEIIKKIQKSTWLDVLIAFHRHAFDMCSAWITRNLTCFLRDFDVFTACISLAFYTLSVPGGATSVGSALHGTMCRPSATIRSKITRFFSASSYIDYHYFELQSTKVEDIQIYEKIQNTNFFFHLH